MEEHGITAVSIRNITLNLFLIKKHYMKAVPSNIASNYNKERGELRVELELTLISDLGLILKACGRNKGSIWRGTSKYE